MAIAYRKISADSNHVFCNSRSPVKLPHVKWVLLITIPETRIGRDCILNKTAYKMYKHKSFYTSTMYSVYKDWGSQKEEWKRKAYLRSW